MKNTKRHQQAGCIQGVGTVSLHKRLAACVPSLGHDFFVDLIADFQPAGSVGGKRALVRQAQTAVQGNPRHDLGIDKVPAAAAHFPDAFVLSFPVVAKPVDEAAQAQPAVVADGFDVFVVEINRVHQFAVDVELELPVGRVADSNRA